MAVRLQRGVLIAIEGIDGAGKTTQAELLAHRLRAVGLDVVRSKEPTDGPYGQRIRESVSRGRLPPRDELELFMLDRQQHVEQLVGPALTAGKVVILDRYYLSTASYQGARGLNVDEILIANEAFAPLPDLVVLLEISAAEAMVRIARRGHAGPNHFEREDELQRCAAIFARMSRPFIRRFAGDRPIEMLHQEIVTTLDHGALFRAICVRTNLQECEPVLCSVRILGHCDYPALDLLRPRRLLPVVA